MGYVKEITTSIYTFPDIIKNHCLYVDKTKYIYKLLKVTKGQFFCARPRRFGKSLTVSTLKSVFRGERELFDGLYLGGVDYDWQVHPVIHIDFTRCSLETLDKLKLSLSRELEDNGREYGIEMNNEDVVIMFRELIRKLYKKTGQGVVVLVDEYDKPIFEHMWNAKEAQAFREFMSYFYQIIKGSESMLRFTFMTGVTKLAKLSVFSNLNNINDITMDDDFASMFGYTQQELEDNFNEWIDGAIKDGVCSYRGEQLDRSSLLDEIKLWYDGFRFTENAETVYNPVSIGQFFMNRHVFANYWFETGTPSFLIKLLKRNRLMATDIDKAVLSEMYLRTFDIAELAGDDVPDERILDLLFQSGYLTIDRLLRAFPERIYKMRFPNHEVAYSFEQDILASYMTPHRPTAWVNRLLSAAEDGRTADMVDVWKDFFVNLPYDIQIKAEKYYQSIVYTICRLCAMDIVTETATNRGRIDAVMTTDNHVYIIEFKLNKTADIALEQIGAKGYAEKYIADAKKNGKTIHAVGINFSYAPDNRNITGWKEKIL